MKLGYCVSQLDIAMLLQERDYAIASDGVIVQICNNQKAIPESRIRGHYSKYEIHVRCQIQRRIGVQHIYLFEVMALAHLEVIEVVRGRDLHRAGAFLRIGVFIGDDGNAPADQRQDRVPADEMPVALVGDAPRPRRRRAWSPAAWSPR